MPSIVDNMLAELANVTARLAELDAQPLNQAMNSTITDGDVQLSFNDYRASLVAQRSQLLKDIGAARAVTQGPFNVKSSVRG